MCDFLCSRNAVSAIDMAPPYNAGLPSAPASFTIRVPLAAAASRYVLLLDMTRFKIYFMYVVHNLKIDDQIFFHFLQDLCSNCSQ